MQRILWLDLEMTGLDVERERVIEIAAVVTDLNFDILADYQAIIKQPQEFIDNMDEWNKKQHKASGLIEKIASGKEERIVEKELNLIIDQYFKGERAVIGGNTISQDRLFIRKYFPVIESKLHYRMLDVTSWKLIFKNKLAIEFEKKSSHRAVDDIHESIAELKFYLSHVQVSQ